MNPRARLLSSVLTLFLLLLGLIAIILLSSLITAGLSALPLLFSGAEIPKFSELASRAAESDGWMIVSDLLRGLGALGLTGLMLERYDRLGFHFQDVGITKSPSPLIMALAGMLVMTAIFFSTWGLASLRLGGMGEESLSPGFSQAGASRLLVLAISTLANAFWQELVFRGYLQPQFQRSFGILPGILVVSTLFAALHGLLEPVTIPELITGIILFSFVGWLYFITNSIWLATALHATANFYLILFSEVGLALPPHLDRALVYTAALIVAYVLLRRRAPQTLDGAM